MHACFSPCSMLAVFLCRSLPRALSVSCPPLLSFAPIHRLYFPEVTEYVGEGIYMLVGCDLAVFFM